MGGDWWNKGPLEERLATVAERLDAVEQVSAGAVEAAAEASELAAGAAEMVSGMAVEFLVDSPATAKEAASAIYAISGASDPTTITVEVGEGSWSIEVGDFESPEGQQIGWNAEDHSEADLAAALLAAFSGEENALVGPGTVACTLPGVALVEEVDGRASALLAELNINVELPGFASPIAVVFKADSVSASSEGDASLGVEPVQVFVAPYPDAPEEPAYPATPERGRLYFYQGRLYFCSRAEPQTMLHAIETTLVAPEAEP